MFCNNTTYFIASKNENVLMHIQTYLNSPLIDWYYRTLSVQLGEKAVRMFSIYVLEIPIPPMLNRIITKSFNSALWNRKFLYEHRLVFKVTTISRYTKRSDIIIS